MTLRCGSCHICFRSMLRYGVSIPNECFARYPGLMICAGWGDFQIKHGSFISFISRNLAITTRVPPSRSGSSKFAKGYKGSSQFRFWFQAPYISCRTPPMSISLHYQSVGIGVFNHLWPQNHGYRPVVSSPFRLRSHCIRGPFQAGVAKKLRNPEPSSLAHQLLGLCGANCHHVWNTFKKRVTGPALRN